MQIRLIYPQELTDPTTLAGFRSVISAPESERIAKFVFEEDRHVRLIARASLRLSLSEMSGIAPADLRFSLNGYGKPLVLDPRVPPFNLSHTKGLVAILIGRQMEVVGVDVEGVRTPMSDLKSLAARFFAPPEAADVGRLDGESAQRRFFQYWTLKEAYIKARGMGLSIPLNDFWFELGGASPTIQFSAKIPDNPARWRFTQEFLPSGHSLATAIAPADSVLDGIEPEAAKGEEMG